MAQGIYNRFKEEVMEGAHDLLTDNIRVALLNSTHAFDPDAATNDSWSEVSANEVSGTGYSAGGELLGTKTVTVDDANDRGAFDAADTTWGSSTITARYAVVYNDSATTPTADCLIACYDFSTDQESASGNFTLQYAAAGLILIT